MSGLAARSKSKDGAKQVSSAERQRSLLIAAVAATVVIIVVLIGYTRMLNGEIRNTTLSSMEELVDHDATSIDSYVAARYEDLEGAATRMSTYELDNVEALQEQLNLESSTLVYENMYLVTEEGLVYTDRYAVYNPREEAASGKLVSVSDFLSYFEQYGEKFSVLFQNESRLSENRKEMLAYGVSMDLTVQDQHFVGLAGLSKVSSIQDNLSLTSWNGEGYSSVIDEQGYYVVDVDRTMAVNARGNYFERLAQGSKLSMSEEDIRAAMQNRETFDFKYTDAKGVAKYLFMKPVSQGGSSNEGWYFVSMVPESVVNQQSSSLIMLSIVAMLIIGAVLVALVVAVYRSSTKMVQVEASAKARSDFLSNMSHEIRTPLNGLIGLNHLMHSSLDNRGKLESYLSSQASTAQYLLNLLNDILDMSKLQAGKVDLVLKPAALEALLGNVRSMQMDNIKVRNGIEFNFDTQLSHPYVIIDETRVKQVLMNIVGNAGKFTEEGGSITVTTRQNPLENGLVQTCISVADTGCGISPEFQKVIFESFSQEREKIHNSVKGTGLGMSISALLMQAMNGTIEVESELGRGSTFTIKFPAQVCSREDMLAAAKEAGERYDDYSAGEDVEGEAAEPKTLNILVAEDNELNAMILEEILKENGYTVTIAEDGKLALDRFSASEVGEYDLILMDMQMPVMDGCSAAKAIRALDREDAAKVPIFACTANTFEEDRQATMQAGMNDFLAKPIDVNILNEKLRRLQRK